MGFDWLLLPQRPKEVNVSYSKTLYCHDINQLSKKKALVQRLQSRGFPAGIIQVINLVKILEILPQHFVIYSSWPFSPPSSSMFQSPLSHLLSHPPFFAIVPPAPLSVFLPVLRLLRVLDRVMARIADHSLVDDLPALTEDEGRGEERRRRGARCGNCAHCRIATTSMQHGHACRVPSDL